MIGVHAFKELSKLVVYMVHVVSLLFIVVFLFFTSAMFGAKMVVAEALPRDELEYQYNKFKT